MFAGEEATVLDLARAALGAGDAVMSRLWSYVKDDGGRIDEQIDKHTGGAEWGAFIYIIIINCRSSNICSGSDLELRQHSAFFAYQEEC